LSVIEILPKAGIIDSFVYFSIDELDIELEKFAEYVEEEG